MIKIVQLVGIQFVKHIVGGDGHGGHEGKRRRVGGDFHAGGKLQPIRRKIQILLHTGQGKADNHALIPVADNLAVADGYILEVIVVQNHAGQHHEGHIQLLRFSIDGHRLLLVIGVGKGHGDLAAFTGQFLGGDAAAVQFVRDGDVHRQLFLDLALIINILPLRVPQPHIVGVHGIALVAFDVRHLGQLVFVGDYVLLERVFQPVADNDFPHGAVGVGQDVYRFFLLNRAGRLRLLGCGGSRRRGVRRLQGQGGPHAHGQQPAGQQDGKNFNRQLIFHDRYLLETVWAACPGWFCLSLYRTAGT